MRSRAFWAASRRAPNPKGDVISGKKTGRQRIARTGTWCLEVEERDAEDLNSQIAEILDRLNPDPDVWASLSSEFRMDLFCGLFMASGNDGVSLSPAALVALGSRGIELTSTMRTMTDLNYVDTNRREFGTMMTTPGPGGVSPEQILLGGGLPQQLNPRLNESFGGI